MHLSKKLVLILFVFLVMGALKARAQGFEGVIYYKAPGINNAQGGTMEYMVKGSKVRMQMGKQSKASAAILYLPGQSKMVVLIDQMKGYFQTSTNDEESEQTYSGKWKNSTMKETGEQKTIAGHSCEVWHIESDKGDKLSICMAEGLGSFMTPANPMAQQGAPAWAKKVSRSGNMPLKVVEVENGKQNVLMVATEIKEKSLDSSLFKIPDGYRDISAMINQLKNKQQKK